MPSTRRAVLAHGTTVAGLLAALGSWPRHAQAAWAQAAFESRNLTDIAKAVGGRAPVESRDVVLAGPDIAENGASVQFGLSTTLPGVRRMLLLVEKNPFVLAAVLDVSDAIETDFLVHVKMAQSSNVFAVAVMHDGRTLFARKDVRVTLGGCGA